MQGVTPATGDPVYCTSCRGVLSIHSVLVGRVKLRSGDLLFATPVTPTCNCSSAAPPSTDNGEAGTSTADAADGGDDDDDDSKTWTCEFCGTINDSVELEPEEIPSTSNAVLAGWLAVSVFMYEKGAGARLFVRYASMCLSVGLA